MKGQVLLLSNSIDSAEETHSIITHVFMQKNDAERNDVMYYIQSKVVRLKGENESARHVLTMMMMMKRGMLCLRYILLHLLLN